MGVEGRDGEGEEEVSVVGGWCIVKLCWLWFLGLALTCPVACAISPVMGMPYTKDNYGKCTTLNSNSHDE